MTDNRERTETVIALEQIKSDLKWHNAIGKSIFSVSLVLIAVSISTLVYFGRLDERVTRSLSYTSILDIKMSEGQEKVHGQFLRIQSRMRDVEKAKHAH
jgi:hypothetical protein